MQGLVFRFSDEIKERAKALNFSRYKIIVQCTVGENKRQGVLITSRCLWEPSCDNYMSYSFKNDQVWVNVMVFGLHFLRNSASFKHLIQLFVLVAGSSARGNR